jgi:hypothetical protein
MSTVLDALAIVVAGGRTWRPSVLGDETLAPSLAGARGRLGRIVVARIRADLASPPRRVAVEADSGDQPLASACRLRPRQRPSSSCRRARPRPRRQGMASDSEGRQVFGFHVYFQSAALPDPSTRTRLPFALLVRMRPLAT